jgi:hypothetical protein
MRDVDRDAARFFFRGVVDAVVGAVFRIAQELGYFCDSP